MRKSHQYIFNLALTLIQQLQVPQSLGGSALGPQDIYTQFGEKIVAKLKKMNPETLGRISSFGLEYDTLTAWSGKTSLYEVHCGSYLGKYQSGRGLLIEIACTAICAQIFDTLRSSEFKEWNKIFPGRVPA